MMTTPMQLQRSNYGRGSWFRARVGNWRIQSELMQYEVPEIYEMALDLLSEAFDSGEVYTHFVIDIKPGRSAFLHPGHHQGMTTTERCYLILTERDGVLIKHSGYPPHKTMSLNSRTANDIGNQLRKFMQMCMENYLASEAAQWCADDEVDPASMVAAVRQAAVSFRQTRLEQMRRGHEQPTQRMWREHHEVQRLMSGLAFAHTYR